MGKIYKKAHLNLIQYALDKGCSMSVDDDGDELAEVKSTSFTKIKEAVEAVDVSNIIVYDASGTRLGFAFIVLGNADYELVADHTDNDWFNTWWDQYEEVLG